MVNINKMKLRIKHYPNWFDRMSLKLDLAKTNSNSEFQYYDGELFFHDDRLSSDFDEDRNLIIKLTKAKDYFGITILGSLQGWYFGLTSNEDFSKSTLNDCIILLSEKLLIPRSHLSKATIMEFTWKTRIGFRKEQGNFMNCILEHKTLKNKSTIGNTKIIFSGNGKKFLITKKKNYQKNGNEEKFHFYVHFQLESKTLSNDKFLIDNAHSPKEILKNWDEMVDEWENQMNNLVIVNSFSSVISDYLNNSNMTKMSGYLVYVGIKHYGLENFRQLMTDKMVSKKLYEYRNNYMKIYEKFENIDTPNYRSYFETNVEIIAEKLKN